MITESFQQELHGIGKSTFGSVGQSLVQSEITVVSLLSEIAEEEREMNHLKSLIRFHAGDIEMAQSELRWISQHCNSSKYCSNSPNPIISPSMRINKMVYDRTRRFKPLQYLLGTQPFCHLDFHVQPPVLIPRPETEELCMYLIRSLPLLRGSELNILDIGCGSGCISVSLAHHLSLRAEDLDVKLSIVAVDFSDRALRLARLNSRLLSDDIVSFRQLDLFSDDFVRGLGDIRYDVVVSNPPYVTPFEYRSELGPDVLKWEDRAALVGTENDDDGMKYYRRILEVLPAIMRSQPVNDSTISISGKSRLTTKLSSHIEEAPLVLPVLALETGGEEQIGKLRNYSELSMFRSVQTFSDFAGVERFIVASGRPQTEIAAPRVPERDFPNSVTD